MDRYFLITEAQLHELQTLLMARAQTELGYFLSADDQKAALKILLTLPAAPLFHSPPLEALQQLKRALERFDSTAYKLVWEESGLETTISPGAINAILNHLGAGRMWLFERLFRRGFSFSECHLPMLRYLIESGDDDSDYLDELIFEGKFDEAAQIELVGLAVTKENGLAKRLLDLGWKYAHQRDDGSLDSPAILHAAYPAHSSKLSLFADSEIARTRDSKGNTPLHEWARHGYGGVDNAIGERLCKLIDIDARNRYRETPLHLTIGADNIRYMEWFLQHANVDAQGKNGNTALHLACLKLSSKKVKLILAAGADTTIRNDDNQTAWELTLARTSHLANSVKKAQIQEAYQKAGKEVE